MPNTITSNFLTPPQLSKRWAGAFTTGTLANWRSMGKGPSFTKLEGKVLYPIADLEAWEAENMRAAANDNGEPGEGAGAGEGGA